MNDLRDVGHYLLQALSACQQRITEGKAQWEAGTTTLLGGLLRDAVDRSHDHKLSAASSESDADTLLDCFALLSLSGEPTPSHTPSQQDCFSDAYRQTLSAVPLILLATSSSFARAAPPLLNPPALPNPIAGHLGDSVDCLPTIRDKKAKKGMCCIL